MGELPSTRIQTLRPFLTTGLDYAGPISLRLGPPRSKCNTKGYIAIFVCFVTKAVHIEVVTSLATEAFLAALRRSIARRGKPRTICSYNGTNCQWTSCSLQNASIHITDGNSTGLFGHWRMRMEIHSTTWTALRRIMGRSSEIYEVSSAKNTGFSVCHLRGTVHITCRDRGLSKLQTLVCPIWLSFQPNLLVSWKFSKWWTTYPITCYWLYWCQMQ